MNTRTKTFATLAVVGTVAAVAAVLGLSSTNNGLQAGSRFLEQVSNEDMKTFQNFVHKHGRNYLTKEEFKARFDIFAENLAKIKAHDPVASGYTIGITKFADLSGAEFEKMQGYKPQDNADGDKPVEPRVDPNVDPNEDPNDGRRLQSYPMSLDWRNKSALNPIRN
jgi:KDEL-tailed cysteine endopeptidase